MDDSRKFDSVTTRNIWVAFFAALAVALAVFMAVYLKDPDSTAERTLVYAVHQLAPLADRLHIMPFTNKRVLHDTSELQLLAQLRISTLRGNRVVDVKIITGEWAGIYWVGYDKHSGNAIIAASEAGLTYLEENTKSRRRDSGGKRGDPAPRRKMAIWAVGLDGLAKKRLFEGLVGAPLAHDPRRRLLYFAAKEGGAEEHLSGETVAPWQGEIYRMDLATGESRRIKSIGAGIDPLSLRISPEGGMLSYKNDGEPQALMVYDTGESSVRRIALDHKQAYHTPERGYFARAHNDIKWVEGRKPAAGGPSEAITPYLWLSGSEIVYGDENDRMISLDVSSGESSVVEDGCAYPRLLSPDGQAVLCAGHADDAPRKLALYDIGRRESTSIYSSITPLQPLLVWGRDSRSLVFARGHKECALGLCADRYLHNTMMVAFLDEKRVFPVDMRTGELDYGLSPSKTEMTLFPEALQIERNLGTVYTAAAEVGRSGPPKQ